MINNPRQNQFYAILTAQGEIEAANRSRVGGF